MNLKTQNAQTNENTEMIQSQEAANTSVKPSTLQIKTEPEEESMLPFIRLHCPFPSYFLTWFS